MTRKQLFLDSQKKVLDFILHLEGEEEDNCEYVLEDYCGHLRVNARSITGVLYASRDFEDLYIVNCTNDGEFPSFMDNYCE